MTLSPSLKKVNDALADENTLHHRWDKKDNVNVDDGNNNIFSILLLLLILTLLLLNKR